MTGPQGVRFARSIASGCAAAMIACAIGGCASTGGWRAQVRAQASRDNRCPVRSVRVVRDDGEARGRRVTLEVCGKVRSYRDVATLSPRGERRPRGPRWRPVRRRRHRQEARVAPERRRAPRRAATPSVSPARAEKAAPPPAKRRPRSRARRYSAEVRRVVTRAAIDTCIAACGRRSSPGVLVVVFSIGPRGRVIEAYPEVEQVPPLFSSCVVNRIRDLRFPCPPRGRATFHFPFHIQPAP